MDSHRVNIASGIPATFISKWHPVAVQPCKIKKALQLLAALPVTLCRTLWDEWKKINCKACRKDLSWSLHAMSWVQMGRIRDTIL